MILWRKEFIRPANPDGIVFRRHEAEWILPQACASHLKYNPRHLPTIINREPSHEAYLLYLSIRRIIFGYRAR